MMRLPTFLLFFLLSACSTITINPQAQSGSQIDMNGQRILHAEKGVQLAAKVHDVSVRPSPAEQNYASFWVEVTNKRNVLLPLKFSDFVLLDDQGRQYQATDPAELVDLLTVDASYLLPYPYVGYYYLLDSLRGQADNRFNSESAYYSSRRPEYIQLDALPVAEVLPAATVAGAIYFPVELRQKKSLQLLYQVGALPSQESFQISLPFTVEKD